MTSPSPEVRATYTVLTESAAELRTVAASVTDTAEAIAAAMASTAAKPVAAGARVSPALLALQQLSASLSASAEASSTDLRAVAAELEEQAEVDQAIDASGVGGVRGVGTPTAAVAGTPSEAAVDAGGGGSW